MTRRVEWAAYHAFHSAPARKQNLSGYVRYFLSCHDIHPKRSFHFSRELSAARKAGVPLLVFLHIPKTGGTYLTHCLQRSRTISINHCLLRDHLDDRHVPVGLVGTHWQPKPGCVVFTTVRNPLTFFRSYYHHVVGHGKYHNKQHYDYPVAEKGFAYLMEAILDRENAWPSRKFLYPQLFDQSGKLVPQWINRCEHLDGDMEDFASQYGVDFSPGERKRSAPVDPLDRYYSEALMERVISHYSREMSVFGYGQNTGSEQEQTDRAGKMLLGDVSGSGYRYNYLSDHLDFINQE